MATLLILQKYFKILNCKVSWSKQLLARCQLLKALTIIYKFDENFSDIFFFQVHLWDSGTGQLVQRLLTGGVTVDMCSFNINNTTYLATLTDKQCKVFKWT